MKVTEGNGLSDVLEVEGVTNEVIVIDVVVGDIIIVVTAAIVIVVLVKIVVVVVEATTAATPSPLTCFNSSKRAHEVTYIQKHFILFVSITNIIQTHKAIEQYQRARDTRDTYCDRGGIMGMFQGILQRMFVISSSIVL